MKKQLLLLTALLITAFTQAQMVLEYEIPTAGDSIALPLNGTVDVTVDWGDGTTKDFTEAQNQWHVYATSGTKTVTITGRLTHYGIKNNEGNKFLVAVKKWSGLGLESLSYAFSEAANLREVPTMLPATVTSLDAMFIRASSFNQNIDLWNTASVTDMRAMFYSATSFNKPVGTWNTQNVTDMSYMFKSATSFNQSIGAWDVAKVTDMSNMFYSAESFNQPIGNWNTSKVMTLNYMFYKAFSFNQDIEEWNTESVTDMYGVFREAISFNQPVNGWNTSSVKSMNSMFQEAVKFNQPIENWNTDSLTDMTFMFDEASSFNQSLGELNISRVTNMGGMFIDASLCTENYDATLKGWASQDIQDGIHFSGGTSKYSIASEDARTILHEKNWTIYDHGLGTTEDDRCGTILSTEIFSTTSTLEVYPNPVQDKLQIVGTSLSHYAIFSLTGNLVEEASVRSSTIEVDLSELQSGIYILQTESQAGIQTPRFTKQ